MIDVWYYVEGEDKVGPLRFSEIENKIMEFVITDDTYVWAKGMDNWSKAKEVEDLHPSLFQSRLTKRKDFSWDKINDSDRSFTIRIGLDRGGQLSEYGPYSLEMIKKFINEKRVNAKTLIFTPGMEDWIFLAEVPFFASIFKSSLMPEKIDPSDQRGHVRKPFVAKLFFHNKKEIFEGVCRDISIGGLQILVSNFPGKVGDQISLNVHPENGDHCFVADGEIVRVLPGNSGFSLRFVNLDPNSKKSIESYLVDDD